MRSRQHQVGAVVVALAAFAIAIATLLPTGSPAGGSSTFWCLLCGRFGAVDVTLNVLLFIPLGVGLTVAGASIARATVVAAAATFAIELLQFTVISGRDSSLSDLLTNTSGGAIGALLGTHWRGILGPSAVGARLRARLLALGWLSLRFGGAFLLSPSVPDSLWFGQVAPPNAFPAAFRGSVVAGTIDSLDVRVGPFPELREHALDHRLEVEARLVRLAPTPALASVLSVVDDKRREVLVLGQDGTSARFRVRRRATDLEFRSPSLSLPGGLAWDTSAVVTLRGLAEPRALSITAASGDVVRSARLPLPAGLAWSVLLPFDTGLEAKADVVTAITTAAMVLLLTIALAAGFPRHRWLLSLAIVTAGLFLPSLAFLVAPPSGAECGAALLAVLAGCGRGRATPMRRLD